jgi:hypothetical protein
MQRARKEAVWIDCPFNQRYQSVSVDFGIRSEASLRQADPAIADTWPSPQQRSDRPPLDFIEVRGREGTDHPIALNVQGRP